MMSRTLKCGREFFQRNFELILWLLVVLSLVPVSVGADPESKVSKPGEYSGFSRPVYKDWTRISQYVAVRDGTKLAVDIFRPVQNGQPVEEPLPVIWTYDRYHRADLKKGKLVTQLDQEPWLRTMLQYGYVVGVVDARGSGASFGDVQEPFGIKEANDGYDITEWFAAQSWCSQRVGMFGRSYLGITQYLTAATAPPHLRAIFPEMALFDLYSFMYAGGVFRSDFADKWGRLVKQLDTANLAPPVDSDSDGQMLKQAIAMHEANRNVPAVFQPLPFRDSVDPQTGSRIYQTNSPSQNLERVKKSGVAIYHMAGWHDLWPRDALLWYSNLNNPQKIIIGPWSHDDSRGFNLAAEHLRWYDYWLKGIDNGIMNEPPIQYYTMGAGSGHEWRSASKWPVPQATQTKYFFGNGKSASVASANDGTLGISQPAETAGQDDYTLNYTTTSGTTTRWSNGYGQPFGYGNMLPNDQKGLTYTTPRLTENIEVTGHPVAHLWVTTKAKDADFFVYLEEIDEFGGSQYITEGTLRASHRALSTPTFNNLSLPYHRSNMKDSVPIGDKPVELVFDLHPTSNIFNAGNRIRITITGSDRDNTSTPEQTPSPVVSILRNSAFASYVTLPLVPVAAQDVAPVTVVSQANRVNPVVPPNSYWPVMLIVVFAACLLFSSVFFLKLRRKAN